MISVIIPTFNEAACIKKTVQALWNNDIHQCITEILIADGGSSDATCSEAQSEGVTTLLCPVKGRAAQMNYAASSAKGNILYFLHADTLPPVGFTNHIVTTLEQGHIAGCFMLAFDHSHWFLEANCWFTRFNFNYFRFGDQSLFIGKDAFMKCGGFSEKHIVLEDQEIIHRIKRLGKFSVVKIPVMTSARKYLDNGIFKTQGIFYLIYAMYKMRFPQRQLLSTYRKLMRQNKL